MNVAASRAKQSGLGAILALVLSASPYTFTFDGGQFLKPAIAIAKDGGSGGGGESGGGSSGRGGGGDDGGGSNSGRGGGDDGAGDDSGGRGRGADDGAGDDNGGRARNGARGDDSGRRRGIEHINLANGAKVEISGRNIEVEYANGTKEEIENGRYEMKDAQGRTIVERGATAADRARLASVAQ